MRQFWLVVRFKDSLLQPHPAGNGRDMFQLASPDASRNSQNGVVCMTEAVAETVAKKFAQDNPTESVIIMNQKVVYEIPSMPDPIRKMYNEKSELVPHEG